LKRKTESAACLKYSVFIFVEKNIYKMQHLEGSGTPVLYIGRTVLKGYIKIVLKFKITHPQKSKMKFTLS
jgi:protein-disulfide isomerase